MNPPEALQECAKGLRSLGERLDATETLCCILFGHIARQRHELQAAQASLARAIAAAKTQPNSVLPQEDQAWFNPVLK